MIKTGLYTPQPPRYSRQWWLDGARNMVFVGLITLLIWVYADMDVADDREFRAVVVLTTGQSSDFVLTSPPQREVRFTLRGTRRSLRAFQDYLDENRSEIHCDVSRKYKPGKTEMAVEELLEQGEWLSQLSLSLVTAAPSKIDFVLSRRITRTARVELDQTGAKLVGQPKISPSEVTMHLVTSDLAAIRQSLPPDGQITLKTRQLDLRNAPTDKPYVAEVAVLPPPSRFGVTIEPRTVTVTVRIDQRTDTKQIAINVQTIAPSAWSEENGTWQEYRLVKKDPLEWRKEIAVSGAKKDIERLRPEDVDAHIVLTEDDKAPIGSWQSRTVIVRFPPGMDLQLVGEAPVVHFKLEKRPAPGGERQ